MKSHALAVFLAALTVFLAGCVAPGPVNTTTSILPDDGGHEIITVDPDKDIGPYRTVGIDGAELLQSRGEPGKFGGNFYEGQIGDGPKTFNSWASFDATSSAMAGMLFTGLVSTDAYTGETVPWLAKEVKLLDDRMTYIVTLRKGLEWSDGHPITSKDVVFTWNDIIGKGLGNPSSRDVTSVEGKFPTVRALDDLTIEFKTAKPFAPFLSNLSQPIAPEHIMAKVARQGNNAFSAFWGVSDAVHHPEKFVGNGMWLLERYDTTQQKIVFKRNPKYFMVDADGKRLPYLDRYIISFVSDMNNLQLQFEQGRVDVYSVPGQYVSHVRMLSRPKFKMYNRGPTSGTTFVTFNLTQRKHDKTGRPFVDPVKSGWFRDTNFRKAVDYAINREDMVNNILKGVGAPLFTSESLASIYLNKDIAQGHPMDLDKARALLKASGFTWDKQERLHDARGRLVEFNLYTNSGNDQREGTGVNIKQDLARLGIKVNFKPMEFNVLIGKLQEGSWEAVIMGLTGSNLEPNSGANVWNSDGGLHMFNQRDVFSGKPVDLSDRFPWEREIDALMREGVLDFEFEKRKKVYDRLQEVVYQQAPFIYLYSPLSVVAIQERIQNADPTELDVLHNLESIWIDEDADKRGDSHPG